MKSIAIVLVLMSLTSNALACAADAKHNKEHHGDASCSQCTCDH